MVLTPVTVESYSGYKADEYPKCFYWNFTRYDIQEIKDRWYQTEPNPLWPVSDYFRIVTMNGAQYLIKQNGFCVIKKEQTSKLSHQEVY